MELISSHGNFQAWVISGSFFFRRRLGIGVGVHWVSKNKQEYDLSVGQGIHHGSVRDVIWGRNTGIFTDRRRFSDLERIQTVAMAQFQPRQTKSSKLMVRTQLSLCLPFGDDM